MKGVLESEGIEAFVKNEFLSGLAGEVPFMESWPEVWVVHDEESDHAQAIIADYNRQKE
jgi:hypothetical protein